MQNMPFIDTESSVNDLLSNTSDYCTLNDFVHDKYVRNVLIALFRTTCACISLL